VPLFSTLKYHAKCARVLRVGLLKGTNVRKVKKKRYEKGRWKPGPDNRPAADCIETGMIKVERERATRPAWSLKKNRKKAT
jgi:hypothetical protein